VKTWRAVTPPAPRFAVGVICGLAAAAIWGGGAVVSRHLVTANLAPADLTLLRYLGCFPVALLLVLVMGERFRLAMAWPRLAILLLLAGPLYHALVVAGYGYATAGGGALLLSGLLPLFALALSCTRNACAPSWLAAIGMAVILFGLVLFGGSASVSLAGLAIFAAAAFAWAMLNECVRRWNVEPMRLTVVLALSSPLFIPFYLLGRPSPSLAAPMSELLLQLVYHGWLVAIGATALFFASVRLAGAAAAAILQTLAPAFSAGLGAAILGESLALLQWLGLILTLLGVLVTMRASITAQVSEPRPPPSWLRSAFVGFGPRLKQSR